jgi:hypothetical protein
MGKESQGIPRTKVPHQEGVESEALVNVVLIFFKINYISHRLPSTSRVKKSTNKSLSSTYLLF